MFSKIKDQRLKSIKKQQTKDIRNDRLLFKGIIKQGLMDYLMSSNSTSKMRTAPAGIILPGGGLFP